MKMIGLIGGMSWESTVTYYQLINEAVKEKLGGLHSAKILLYSVDFAQIEQYQISGMWEQSAELLTDAAKSLEVAGADFIVICTNTMHKVAPQIQKALHIVGIRPDFDCAKIQSLRTFHYFVQNAKRKV